MGPLRQGVMWGTMGRAEMGWEEEMMLEMLVREDGPVLALGRMCRIVGKILVMTWNQTWALGSVGGR